MGGIPVMLVVPADVRGPVAVWMSHLGGSKDRELENLRALAARGLPAVSFDAVGHGDRAELDPLELMGLVLGEFRLRMWPLLGQTTLDAVAVLDWARDRLGIDAAVAGGVSMGGDVAVALAGIHDRVGRVASVGSTPDWARPGMTVIDDPGRLAEQGEGDRRGVWLRDALDPMLHLDRYRRGQAIAFELGGDDHHIPAENAQRFARLLAGQEAQARVTVRDGLDHLGICRDPDALAACADWLAQ